MCRAGTLLRLNRRRDSRSGTGGRAGADPPAAPVRPANKPHVVPAGSRVVTLMRLKRFVNATSRMIAASALLVVVVGGLVPDRVGHGVGAVGEAGRRLGQRQRGALGVGEVRRLPPRDDGAHSRSSSRPPWRGAGAHVDADAAAVDLAGPQVDELEDLGRARRRGWPC